MCHGETALCAATQGRIPNTEHRKNNREETWVHYHVCLDLMLQVLELGSCSEANYRKRIGTLGATDSSWKKNRSCEDNAPVETTLHRHSCVKNKIELHRWGILVLEKEVNRIRNQDRVPFRKLHDPTSIDTLIRTSVAIKVWKRNGNIPELPKGWVLRFQHRDQLHIEPSLQDFTITNLTLD